MLWSKVRGCHIHQADEEHLEGIGKWKWRAEEKMKKRQKMVSVLSIAETRGMCYRQNLADARWADSSNELWKRAKGALEREREKESPRFPDRRDGQC